jgi:hypothetical protein
MYGDRDVAVGAPQDVLERSPAMGIRPPGRRIATLAGDSRRLSRLKPLPQSKPAETTGFDVRGRAGVVGGQSASTFDEASK